jgi:cytosine/adenosine deaminase-related metal-dependent hydrolase
MDLLIKNGLVLTFENGTLKGRIIPDGALAVRGSRIAEIGKSADLEEKYGDAQKVIDASGRLVMPGFIVTHTHMPYVLGHNMPVDFSKLHSFWDMLQKMGWEWLEDITTKEGVYAATRYAALKMLRHGTTTVCELVEAPCDMDGVLDESARAVLDAGIRAQIGYETTERVVGKPILTDQKKGNADRGFAENIRFIKQYPKNNGSRVEGRLGVHTAFTNSFETLKKARALADEYGCGIQIHIAEIPRAFLVEKYGVSAPEYLEKAGLLGPDVVAAHCIDLTDGDMEILARNNVNVAHTPMTNSLGGNGVARVPEMMAMGMNVSVGHDCFFSLDVAEYMRYAYLVHKAARANPNVMLPFEVLDMFLGNGAKALGLGKEIGSLEVGKKADILIIRPDSPVPVAPCSAIGYLVNTFQGEQVETVVVDGEIMIENKRSTRVNEEEAAAACVREAKILWRKNGIEI